jgi:hypothetical protein
LDEEAGTVAVTVTGIPSELEVIIEALEVEVGDGVDDVEEGVIDVLGLDLRQHLSLLESTVHQTRLTI